MGLDALCDNVRPGVVEQVDLSLPIAQEVAHRTAFRG